MRKMQVYWIWFAMLPALRIELKLALLERFSDPEDIYNATTDALSRTEGITPEALQALENKDLRESRRICEVCRRKNIGILAIGDSNYPSRLRNIADPPVVLYYRGKLPNFEEVPVISVVGTRKATAYGLNTARTVSRQIAACGGLVASGGAAGVDTMAMQGALEAGAPVVGVLGCGVDVVYPKSNGLLFAKTVEQGCLLSEYPPGTQPLPWHFPQRNRILSGIANGVLVVEAPERSGALITARQALEQGRDVFVVPGNIDVVTCAGSNALLQDGAAPVFSGWDAVREYEAIYPGKLQRREALNPLQEVVLSNGVQDRNTAAKVAQKSPYSKNMEFTADKKGIDNSASSNYSGIDTPAPVLTQEEREIVRHLGPEPRAVDDVIAELGQPAGKLLSQLTMLALKGVVVNHPGKRVSLKIEIPE